MKNITNINKPNELSLMKENWQNFLELNLFPNKGQVGSSNPAGSFINPMGKIDLIKYPVITEKSYLALFKNGQYTFDVDLRLSKVQIKKVFENLFNVNVIAVNTHIPPRKNIRVGTTQGYRARYKRAILTLKKGQTLKFSIPLPGAV